MKRFYLVALIGAYMICSHVYALPLTDYLVISNFGGGDIFKLDVVQRKSELYLKDKNGEAVFESTFPGMFQVLETGTIVKGVLKNDSGFIYSDAIISFDERGIFLRKLIIAPNVGTFIAKKFSYTGKKILINPYEALAYVDFSEPKKAILVSDDKKYVDAIFLRDDEAIIYQTDDYKIKRYDIKSGSLEILLEASQPILFGDVSYDNTEILCTDESKILILNLKNKELKIVKEYKPGIFTFRNRAGANIYGLERPVIVTGQFAWREDGRGFIFCRYGPWANFLWLGLDESYAEPDLYYYDLETGEEHFLWGGTGKHGIGLLKK